MSLPNISLEQLAVVKALEKENVIVESVAGSGKTTCNLYIAKTYPNKSILLLTYNAKLKMETRERVINLNLSNIETHSYHSFCVKYYDHLCYTDYQIINIINSNLETIKEFSYDIIILDESQDMSPLYYELVCKIIKDNNQKEIQICLLGDRGQSIYDFNKADARFLILADQIFLQTKLKWSKCSLSQSYRITHEMAEFINNCMFQKNIINSSKISKIKPKYIITDVYNDTILSLPFIQIKRLLEKYKPDEIFILAPSVRSEKTPVRQLENLIKTKLKDINVYVPVSDEEKLDEQILKNKLVFSTFHQSKGLERRAVIVYNFDDSYFKFYKKDKNPKLCPNEIYVASTRAKDEIIFIHHYTNNFLEFINKFKLTEYSNILQDQQLKIYKHKEKVKNEVGVSDLIKHLPVEVLNNCISYLEIKQIKPKSDFINIPFKMQQNNSFESVGEITGTAIPSYLELKTKNSMSIYNKILKNNKQIQHKLKDSDNIDFIDDNNENLINKYNIENINLKNLKPDELLYIANYYCSIKSGFLYKIHQINNYNWLSKENLEKCYNRLINLGISNNANYEYYLELENKPELLNKRLSGYIDCIDKNKIYEFKCIEKIENEHILQIAIYMYLHYYNNNSINNNTIINDLLEYIKHNNEEIIETLDPARIIYLGKLNEKLKLKLDLEKCNFEFESNKYNYYLYNILNDEMIEIICPVLKLNEMIKYLFNSKFLNVQEIPNDIFIKNCNTILSKYLIKNTIIQYKTKKYILEDDKAYFITKNNNKGKLFGFLINNKIIKNK